MWLAKVKESYGDNLEIDWRPFTLEQANSKEGPEWKAWDQPNGVLALRAGEAAKRQGGKLFDSFLIALLKARHEERKDLTDLNVIEDIAKATGLELDQFKQDLDDPALFDIIADTYAEAIDQHGVFGVPTLLFGDGLSAFIKTYQPPAEDAVEVFEALSKVVTSWSFIGELKRPQPPWPKGVL